MKKIITVNEETFNSLCNLLTIDTVLDKSVIVETVDGDTVNLTELISFINESIFKDIKTVK